MKSPRWQTPREIIEAFRAEQERIKALGTAIRPPPPRLVPSANEWSDAALDSRATLDMLNPAPVSTPERSGASSAVLMSRTNPDGWKLEELFVQMRADLEAKNAQLAHASSDLARAVVAANSQIIALLFDAEGLQRALLATLDAVGPDQGPRGKPRVGEGS